jgi:hypothetical protein
MELKVNNENLVEGKWISDSKKYTDRIVFKRNK